MKKVLLGLVLVAGMASCVKKHDCECTQTADGMADVVTTTEVRGNKSLAATACEGSNYNDGTSSYNCELK